MLLTTTYYLLRTTYYLLLTTYYLLRATCHVLLATCPVHEVGAEEVLVRLALLGGELAHEHLLRLIGQRDVDVGLQAALVGVRVRVRVRV